jgi:hypothetical protein
LVVLFDAEVVMQQAKRIAVWRKVGMTYDAAFGCDVC